MQAKKIFGVISLILFLPWAGMSQSQTFQFNSIDDPQARTKQTPSGENQERTYYELNSDLFEGDTSLSRGDILQVEIRPGEQVHLKVRRVSKYFENTISIQAVDIDNKENVFSFTYHNGGINGQYHESHSSSIFFEHESSSGKNYMSKTSVEGDDIQQCGVHQEHANVPVPDYINRRKTIEEHDLTAPNIAAMGGESLNDTITVDLMIVYTQKAQDYAESSNFESIEALIAEAMNYSQAGLDNSNIEVNLRLVHTHKTDYDDDGDDDIEGGTHLRRLTHGAENGVNLNTDEENYDGYMEEVHPLRDEHGADLVALIASEPNTGGIAWMNNSTAGRPDLGFSVNRAEQVGRTFTLVHEVGHNFGNAHARNQEEADAGSLGGLFIYSTGYLSPEGYNTIMAYGERPVPYFSNPDFIDPETNQRLGTNRANSVLTMRQVKRSIASYRLSHTDPPAATIVDNAINIALTDNNPSVTVPVPINNNGDSDLMWSIDFDMTSTSAEPAVKGKAVSYNQSVEVHHTAQQGLMDNEFAYADEHGVIFETGFEADDGFTETGVTDTMGGWRVLIDDMDFYSSDENPSSGLQHIRMQSSTETDDSFIAVSPFFGLQPFGEYEVSMDVAINQTATDVKDRFDIYLFDGDKEEVSSGVVFATGENNLNLMYAYGRNPQTGDDSFFGTQFNYPGSSEYFNLRIVYNAGSSSLDYYINDQMIASNDYAEGKKPDYLWILHSNDEANTSIDVDNIRVTRTAAPFSWLEVDRFGGVTQPDEQDELLLTLSAENAENGTYETELIISSNDPDRPTERIPMKVNIDLDDPFVEPTTPEELVLKQNYPNPFNEFTTIEYDLDDTYPVVLEVFDITGKKIATLVDEEQVARPYVIPFSAEGLASGTYIYRLRTPEGVLTRKMVLVK